MQQAGNPKAAAGKNLASGRYSMGVGGDGCGVKVKPIETFAEKDPTSCRIDAVTFFSCD